MLFIDELPGAGGKLDGAGAGAAGVLLVDASVEGGIADGLAITDGAGEVGAFAPLYIVGPNARLLASSSSSFVFRPPL